jgi:hypothetical protein
LLSVDRPNPSSFAAIKYPPCNTIPVNAIGLPEVEFPVPDDGHFQAGLVQRLRVNGGIILKIHTQKPWSSGGTLL